MDIAIELRGDQEIKELLSNIVATSGERNQAQIQALESEIKKLSSKISAAEEKFNKRSRVLEETAKSVDLARARLEKRKKSWADARRKLMNNQDVLYKVKTTRDELQRELNESAAYGNRHEELYTEQSIENRAFMLSSVMEYVDRTKPVVFSHDEAEKRTTLKWFTNDIYIKRRFKPESFPNSFGRFEVSVLFYYSGGYRRVQAKVIPFEDNISVRGYAHPHVQSEGNPCLGNVERMLIEHMGSYDVANVIYTMTEYLRTYNPADPYIKLRDLGVQNLWDHHSCPRHSSEFKLNCPECAKESEEQQKAACGLTHSECMLYHRNSHPSSKNGQCVLAEVVPFISMAEEALKTIQTYGEEANVQNNDETNS